MDDYNDAIIFLSGLKDGTVAITGADSKLSLCNANVSGAQDIWYYNWEPYTVNVST